MLPHPDSVEILETRDEAGNVNFTLYTHEEDTGIAIGKGGKTAHALRELLKVKAMQTGERVSLTIKPETEKENNSSQDSESHAKPVSILD